MRRIAALISILATLIAFAPARSSACMNEIIRSRDQLIRQLVRAERELSNGHPARAYQILHRGWFADEAYSRGLELRYGATDAIAIVRLDGGVARGGPRRDVTPEARRRNLLGALDRMNSAREVSSSPKVEQWLAEAQIAEGGASAQGIATLERLSAEDLMTDAYGFAVLARVSTGDRAEEYRRSCVTRAGRAARRICPRAPVIAAPT